MWSFTFIQENLRANVQLYSRIEGTQNCADQPIQVMNGALIVSPSRFVREPLHPGHKDRRSGSCSCFPVYKPQSGEMRSVDPPRTPCRRGRQCGPSPSDPETGPGPHRNRSARPTAGKEEWVSSYRRIPSTTHFGEGLLRDPDDRACGGDTMRTTGPPRGQFLFFRCS